MSDYLSRALITLLVSAIILAIICIVVGIAMAFERMYENKEIKKRQEESIRNSEEDVNFNLNLLEMVADLQKKASKKEDRLNKVHLLKVEADKKEDPNLPKL